MFEPKIDTDLPLHLTGGLVDRTNDSDEVMDVSNKELTISVHIVSNKDGSWSKSRKKVEITIHNDEFKIYGDDLTSDDVNSDTPKVAIVDVHSGIEASITLNAIRSESDTMTESTLIGDDHAKFNVCSKLSTFFKDIV